MQYMLLIYTPTDADPEQAETAAWMSYSQQLQESGAMVAGDGLQGLETATTVRVRDGESLVTDGPFAETKEMLARLLPHRRPRPRRGARLGGQDPERRLRLGRGAPGHGLRPGLSSDR